MSEIHVCLCFERPAFTLDVDLTLPAQGVTALFGPSGSGKTTLLRCIAGLEKAARGQLRFRGQIWQDANTFLPTYQRPLGYVFQEASLFPHLSVLGNLEFGQKRQSAAPGQALEQAIELLGIAPLLSRRPDTLSGGERQRVGIARALAVSPAILLMDEPLASLDLKRKQEILPYLERLRDELAIPILYVSHAPDEVARLADHLVVLENGQAVASGPLNETLCRLDLPIQLGEDAGVVLDAQVVEIDPTWHLARLSFAGGSLWTRDPQLPSGTHVRVRILARDVSLATQPILGSSIQNSLPGQIEAIADDSHPGQALVQLQLGDSRLLARVTRRALHQLDLHTGSAVHVQIKSVALMQ